MIITLLRIKNLIFDKKLNKIMEKEYFLKFKKIVETIVEILKSRELRLINIDQKLNSMSPEDPGISFRISGMRYSIGIWPCGEWSDYYDVESNNYICVFLIHDWLFDKFRPSSADISYDIFLNSEGNYDLSDIINVIVNTKENPIDTYCSICENRIVDGNIKNRRWFYFKEWYKAIMYEITNRLKIDIVPLWVYNVLKLIAYVDSRVEKTTIFEEKDTIPRYTFGFLSTIKCSEDDKSFRKFYYLYSELPRKIIQKLGCDAYFNVADYNKDMSEREIRIRLWKGVVIYDE